MDGYCYHQNIHLSHRILFFWRKRGGWSSMIKRSFAELPFPSFIRAVEDSFRCAVIAWISHYLDSKLAPKYVLAFQHITRKAGSQPGVVSSRLRFILKLRGDECLIRISWCFRSSTYYVGSDYFFSAFGRSGIDRVFGVLYKRTTEACEGGMLLLMYCSC